MDKYEQEYDELMLEGRRVFDLWDKLNDPYAFHKGFEYCYRNIDKIQLTQKERAILEYALDKIEWKYNRTNFDGIYYTDFKSLKEKLLGINEQENTV